MRGADTLDVDELAKATLDCPTVAGLHLGGTRFVATYLPGRRVVGIRADDERVLVSVVMARNASVHRLEKQVRAALVPLVGGRYIDVHVADVDTSEEPEAAEEPLAPARGHT